MFLGSVWTQLSQRGARSCSRQSHQALDAANQSEGERDWFFWVWRPQILAKKCHIRSVWVPFFVFFCSVSGRCGGVECAAIFLGRFFFFANHLAFPPSVFFVCAGGHSNLAGPPCVHGISCADCLQNKALYTLICLRWCFAFYRYSPTVRFVLLRCMGEVEPRLIPVFEGNSDAGQDLKIQSIQGQR